MDKFNIFKNKMNKRTLKKLYYLAWIIGIIAAGILIYGIIKSLLNF